MPTPASLSPHALQLQRAAPQLIALLTVALVVVGMVMGYRISERSGLADLAAVASERLELYASNLETELARYAYLPSLIAIDEDVQALLDDPHNAQVQQRARLKLARVNVRAGSILIFVTAADGEALAASNGYQRHGGDVPGGRTPLPEAARSLGEDATDFFASNESDGTTDYYFVHAVRRAGSYRGHIVVKVSLAPLEATWVDLGLRSLSEKLLVLDQNDVVIMSSVPAWKYRMLGSVNVEALQAQGRYAGATLAPLGMSVERSAQPGSTVVRLADVQSAGHSLHLAQERPVVPLAVRLMTLSDPSDVWRQARYAAWGGGAGGAVLGLLALYWLHRRRAMQQLFKARNALQQAHDQLERQVDERTHELRTTNDELKRQIAQRLQAEDELMQAGKLAVLGQMSAGISHEINQPLTALRALSRNTALLLQSGRTQAVADNLKLIDDMAERMGRITLQLKSFARKGGSIAQPVDLAAAVANVLLLLEHRLRAERIQVQVSVPAGLQVRADTNRLEQVLLNLCTNALDAMACSPDKQLRVSARVGDDERVAVQVADSGEGIPEANFERLFEPFFTTKPAGQGLGLGLVISSKIVREFGGTLRALPTEQGMVFEFDLEAVSKEAYV
ncbi:sensor histidine kinase [Ideonella sp.]|uniref:sensor histidine kinase n=1 Tax=Ideonella sp. TaxID=1929293 RepID=UPI002E335F6D|nr:ATP-binding protein [Ideonella sp.]